MVPPKRISHAITLILLLLNTCISIGKLSTTLIRLSWKFSQYSDLSANSPPSPTLIWTRLNTRDCLLFVVNPIIPGACYMTAPGCCPLTNPMGTTIQWVTATNFGCNEIPFILLVQTVFHLYYPKVTDTYNARLIYKLGYCKTVKFFPHHAHLIQLTLFPKFPSPMNNRLVTSSHSCVLSFFLFDASENCLLWLLHKLR